MATIERRLAALREYLKTISADETVFIVEGGKEFRTKQDAFTFLREHGAYTLDGRRIVLYPHTQGTSFHRGLSVAMQYHSQMETC